MCLIILCPAGTLPSREFVTNAVAANPDGFGVATAKEGKVFISAQLRASGRDAWDQLRHEAGHARLVHFRWRTHGAHDLANVHPFRLGPALAWAHNGVIPRLGDAVRSDSREFAETYLAGYSFSALRADQADVDHYVGRGSLTAALGWHKGKGRFSVGNRECWIAKHGCLWSNSGAFSSPWRRDAKILARHNACVTASSIQADDLAWYDDPADPFFAGYNAHYKNR